ncbi:MAG: hypothetical protein FWE18_06050 [Alphaproteobacteria bacterium]|nr:hypothetical protein [Alphaproteobacteria bacterium]
MKKIIYVNNQEDLIKAICNNHGVGNDKIINQKEINQENCKKNIKNCYKSEKNLIIVDAVLINNLGMVLLRETIDYYNTHKNFILLNVEDSLPFLLFAIENKFNFISTVLKKKDISNIIELAENRGTKIFSFTENIFECLITN